MKPRILIFSVAYEPLVGGAELAVRNITDRLSSYDFDLITCRFARKHKAYEKIGKVNVYRVGFGSRIGRYLFPVLALRQAVRLHRKNPYQLVWAIMAAYGGAAALMFLRRFSRIKFLLTLQEGDSFEHIDRQVRLFRKSWQQLFKRADYIQAISSYLAAWAKSQEATCPVEVVPNGVDLKTINDQQSTIKNLDQNQKVIITVSRLEPKNGIDILIKSIAVIASGAKRAQPDRHNGPFSPGGGGGFGPRDDTEMKLEILGRGSEEKKLKKLARNLGIAEQVDFLGNIKPEKVPQYLCQADIFVRPSRSEGLGTAFLEAMACGLPVIACPIGGIKDFLVEQKTGLFCQPEDPEDLAQQIAKLLQNEELRIKLGRNGRKLIEEKYSWENVAGSMNEILKILTSSI